MDPQETHELGVNNTVKVRLTIPFKQVLKEFRIKSLQQLELQIKAFLKQHGHQLVPYIRKGDRYLSFRKQKDKIKETILKQKNISEVTISSESNFKKVELNEHIINIQFKHQKGYEVQKLAAKKTECLKIIQRMNIKINQKMGTEQQSYYNIVRNIKNARPDQPQHLITFKICFLLSEPIVKKQENNEYTPIVKDPIMYRKYLNSIESIHQHKNHCIDLIFEKVYMSQYSLNTFIKQQNKDNSADFIILQIFIELIQIDERLFVRLQHSNQVGVADELITLKNFMIMLKDLKKLYLIILIGHNMRNLKKYVDRKNNQVDKPMFAQQFQYSDDQDDSEKMFYQCVNVPVLSISTFDANIQQNFLNCIFNALYDQIFTRKSIVEDFKQIFQKVKKFIEEVYYSKNSSIPPISQCCCLHWQFKKSIPEPQKGIQRSPSTINYLEEVLKAQNESFQKWTKLINVLGLSAVHRLFFHNSQSIYVQEYGNAFQRTVYYFNAYFKIFYPNEQRMDRIEPSSEYKHNINRLTKGDFELYAKPNILANHGNKQEVKSISSVPLDKIFIGTVKYNNSVDEEEIITQNKRPKVLFDFINLIASTNQNLVVVIGNPKSGKSQLINQSLNYIKNRIFKKKKYHIQNYKNWLQDYKQSIFIDSIQAKYNALKDQNQMQEHTQTKLILNLGKIHYDVSRNQFKYLIKQLTINQFFSKNKNILFICSCSRSHQFDNEKIKIFEIPIISFKQKLCLILQNKYIRFKQIGHAKKFKEFIDIICKDQNWQKIGQKQLYNFFCTPHLIKKIEELQDTEFRLIKQIQRKYSERGKRFTQIQIVKESIRKQMEKIVKEYENKTIPTLDILKNQNIQLWNDFGFLCSFKKGFLLFRLNRFIALESRQNQQQIKKLKNKNVRLYRIDQIHNLSIQAQPICYDYFQKHQNLFLHRKQKYFFNFYFKLYLLIKYDHNGQNLYTDTRKIQKLGLFMFDFEPFLKQFPLSQKQEQYLSEQQVYSLLQQVSKEQKQNLYEISVRKHMNILLDFLKYINSKLQQNFDFVKLISVEQILAILLLALNFHKTVNIKSGIQFSYLKKQMKIFIRTTINELFKNQIEKQRKQIISSIIYQVFYLLDEQENTVNEIFLKQNCQKKLREILNNLFRYEQIRSEILATNQKLSLLFTSLEEIQEQDNNRLRTEREFTKLAYEVLGIIENANICIDNNINKGITVKEHLQKHFECKIDLIIMKIAIKFKFFNNSSSKLPKPNNLEAERLKKQFMLAKEGLGKLKLYNQNISTICELYLKVKTSFQSTDIQDIPQIDAKKIPKQFQNMLNFVKRKLNPKRLLRQQNIALFMKASCMKVGEIDYAFVRMSNIITSFMHKHIKNVALNLLFMNLSDENFKIVSSNQKSKEISYLVISVDCIQTPQNKLYLIFENGQSLSQKYVSVQQFVYFLKNIRFKVLILFGAKSNQLADYIKQNIGKNIQSSCIIALRFEKCLNLSTCPIGGSNTEIINNFIKVQNSQRLMQMTICSIIYYLCKNVSNKQNLSQYNVDGIVKTSIQNSKKVIQKWHFLKKNYNISYEIKNKNYLSNTIKWPKIPEGKIRNLAQELIPKNFTDDTYYECIGRNSLIKRIMHCLSQYKHSCCIQIEGDFNSGRTKLLEQIGWFSYSRRIFLSGVNRHNTSLYSLLENKKILKQLIQKDYSLQKRFLILIDNLEILLESEKEFLKQFFQNLKNKYISIVFTIKTPHDTKLLKQYIKSGFNKNSHKIHSRQVNKLTHLEKICLVLANLRNRSDITYDKLLREHFCNLMSENSQKMYDEQEIILKNFYIKKNSSDYKSQPGIKTPTLDKQKKSIQKSDQSESGSIHDSLSKQKNFGSLQFSQQYGQIENGMIRTQSISSVQSFQMPMLYTHLSCPPQQAAQMDAGQTISICRRIKKTVNLDFQQSYLKFDTQNILKLLEPKEKNKVEIENQLYF